MFQFQRKKCTQQTTGVVIEKRWNGDVWYIGAKYVVDGKTYKRSEEVRYVFKNQKKHTRHVPASTEAIAKLGGVQEGDLIKVNYNPDKPKLSYFPENEGVKMS